MKNSKSKKIEILDNGEMWDVAEARERSLRERYDVLKAERSAEIRADAFAGADAEFEHEEEFQALHAQLFGKEVA